MPYYLWEEGRNDVAPEGSSEQARPELSFPILRLRPRFWRTELVAVYETHILKGICYRRSLVISEEMCRPAGEDALKGCLSRAYRVDFTDIVDLREEVILQKSHFIVRSKKRKPLRFVMIASQSSALRKAFTLKLADRCWAKIPDPQATEWATWKLMREYPSEPMRSSPILAGPARRKAPVYSQWKGWALKLLGVVYWIFLELIMRLSESSWAESSILLALWMPVPALLFAGYRLCQRPYEPKHPKDSRQPILFLRPFEDDAETSLQPPGLLAALSGIRNRWKTVPWTSEAETGRSSLRSIVLMSHPVRLLRIFFNYDVGSTEESLVRFFESYGPVIAIGKPGERLASPGAVRWYIATDQWKNAVRIELQRAQAVVIMPGLTAGVRWELEEAWRQVEANRVLLCLVSFWRNPQAYEDLCHFMKKRFGLTLPPTVPYLDRPSFVYFNPGWIPHLQLLSYRCPLVWPLITDAVDLSYSLRPFLESVYGGEQQPPRRPLWPGGVVSWSLRSLALVLALIMILLFGLAQGVIAAALQSVMAH